MDWSRSRTEVIVLGTDICTMSYRESTAADSMDERKTLPDSFPSLALSPDRVSGEDDSESRSMDERAPILQ